MEQYLAIFISRSCFFDLAFDEEFEIKAASLEEGALPTLIFTVIGVTYCNFVIMFAGFFDFVGVDHEQTHPELHQHFAFPIYFV
jgi:hypothetical protein